ncbi:MAG: hypothetical protein EOP62_04810 [Sphingomonadales bacterium]|nr:MAG: hypothetical protein EOP62_04810 [Sphingomonadales bacterium]
MARRLNLIEAGVIDPMPVMRFALRDIAAIARLLRTAKAAIVNGLRPPPLTQSTDKQELP